MGNGKQPIPTFDQVMNTQPGKVPSFEEVMKEPVKKKDDLVLQNIAKDAGTSSKGLQPPPGMASPDTNNHYLVDLKGLYSVGTFPEGQKAASGMFSNLASSIGVKKQPVQSIGDFNKEFEEKTGRKEFTLGSDLPQISKERENKKFQEYIGESDHINTILTKVGDGDATLKDMQDLKQKAPRIFSNMKLKKGITVTEDDIPDGPNKEDSYLSRVYNQYKDISAGEKLEIGRQRREQIEPALAQNLPAASAFTGVEYKMPQNLDEAKKILSDLSDKKKQLIFIQDMDASSGFASPSGIIEKYKELNKQINEGYKAYPALKQAVSGFVFDEMSKSNPNVTPFEVGKKIFEISDPEEYALYKAAGGDQKYQPGGYGTGAY